MKTDDLIAALAADERRSTPPHRSLVAAALVGAGMSLAVLLLTLGIRTDVAAALATWRFDLKLFIATVALALALIDCIRLASPREEGVATRASLALPALMATAVLLELALVPAGEWGQRMIGTNALVCLTAIPALSLPPVLIGLWAMRAGAPASPAAAGAAVGRLGAGIAAVLYALHCFDDSPLFVSFWYSLASLLVIAAGALAGRRYLRW